jgi:alkylation response protein AidB-like acyl-CoA dehydrogenase
VNASFSDEQELLRSSAREVLERECPMRLVRDLLDAAQSTSQSLWRTLADLGWMGLALPARYGGSGLGLVELCLVLEEAGRVLLPGPFLSSAVAGLALVRAGDAEQRARWLPGLAAGRELATLALEDASGTASGEVPVAERDGSGFRLTGTRHFVPDAGVADLVLLSARNEDREPLLLLVETRAPGLEVRPVGFVDGTRKQADLHFHEVEIRPEQQLGCDGGGVALDLARVALAAECCGGAARVLDLSVAYAKTREQFGRPIGTFQAIQHRCADMLVRVEAARSATYTAAWALDAETPDAHTTACMAKAYATEAFARVAGDGIQIHGGLGFTWEQDLHLYYKRAKASELVYGDVASHLEEIARHVID